MKANEHKKPVIRVTEGSREETDEVSAMGSQTEKLKKPLIFALMGVVFLGCMYLIFKPSPNGNDAADAGLNDTIPQATGDGMIADKGEAYEQAMLQRKQQEKRHALMSLSDYWDMDQDTSAEQKIPIQQEAERSGIENSYGSSAGNSNPALHSYRDAQTALTSFYDNNDYETQELKRQVEELKEQLAEKDVSPNTTVQDQLDLMEKSYQMAAKYLPVNNPAEIAGVAPPETMASKTQGVIQKQHFVAFTPARKNPVSSLYREPTDSAFLADWGETRNRVFYTAGISKQTAHPKNSIRACVHETLTVSGETDIRLRLLESARTASHTIPAGTVLTAHTKFRGSRLQLQITSVELEGNIIPVDIAAYDMDGQQGLFVPLSPEADALTEMAGNMGQASGTGLMLTQSAGQQVAADLSRGIIQGISGYFSKKVRTPKVTVKAGHRLFLVSKN